MSMREMSGSDFLGFNIRQHPVGDGRSRTNGHGTKLGFKTIITPSKEAQRRQQEKLGTEVTACQGSTQVTLIGHLNPIIRGWTSYYRAVVSKEAFAKMDHLLFVKLLRWAKRRHPKKSAAWVAEKYWHRDSEQQWEFHDDNGRRLRKHADETINRHVKVQGVRSPFDRDWGYWGTRMGRHPDIPRREAILLKGQKGKCLWCGLYFKHGDVREIDHITPLSLGGEDVPHNRQLLHGHCHDAKTATDGSGAARGTHDKGYIDRGAV